jgi:type IV secretion system protein VirB1
MKTLLATIVAACAPQVHPTTMHALIAVESAGNPFAVSINRPGRAGLGDVDLPVFTQPHTANEARRLVQTLHAAGYSTSVGLAQINTENLTVWRLPLTALLDPCMNLLLAQRVLIDCDRISARSPPVNATIRLNETLSCFNSGDPSTGIANGYAARVHLAALRMISAIHPGSFVQ